MNLVSEKALPLYRKLYSPAMESLRSEGAIKTICATTSLYAKVLSLLLD